MRVVHRLAIGEEVAITDGNRIAARIVGESKPVWQGPGPVLLDTVSIDPTQRFRDFFHDQDRINSQHSERVVEDQFCAVHCPRDIRDDLG